MPADIVKIVRDYISEKEGWAVDVYTITSKNVSDKEGNLIVNVIHKDDQKGVYHFGGGKSVELHIDIVNKVVVRELHFQ